MIHDIEAAEEYLKELIAEARVLEINLAVVKKSIVRRAGPYFLHKAGLAAGDIVVDAQGRRYAVSGMNVEASCVMRATKLSRPYRTLEGHRIKKDGQPSKRVETVYGWRKED